MRQVALMPWYHTLSFNGSRKKWLKENNPWHLNYLIYTLLRSILRMSIILYLKGSLQMIMDKEIRYNKIRILLNDLIKSK